MLIALFLLMAGTARAETLLWSQATVTAGVGGPWAVFGEIQPRWWEGGGRKQALLVRAALLYRVSSEWRLGIGGGWTPQYTPPVRNEFRLFEQADWTPSWHADPQWVSAFRFRAEQRRLEQTEGLSHRARALYRVHWMPGALGAYAWDEVFVNLNGKPRQVVAGFDQNRLSFGARYVPVTGLTIEAGLLIQWVRALNTQVVHHEGPWVSVGITL